LASIEVHGQSVTIAISPKAAISDDAIRRLMDRLKTRLRFLSPLSFEIQMPDDDWPGIFSELNTTLQSLGLCDTNTRKPERIPS